MITFLKDVRGYILPMALLLFTSCTLFDEPVSVPAYLEIGGVIPTDTSGAPVPRPAFTDAYVYINGKLAGITQLPGTVALPLDGSTTSDIEIYGGVWSDGQKYTKVSYPFYEGYKTSVNLVGEQRLRLPSCSVRAIKYTPNPLPVDETFEQPTQLSFDTFPGGYANFGKLVPAYTATDEPAAWAPGSRYLELRNTSGQRHRFLLGSKQTFKLQQSTTAPTYAEFDYRSDVPLSVGLAYSYQGTIYTPFELTLNPNPEAWKHAYVFLSNEAQNSAKDVDFRLFIGSDSANPALQQRVQIDNLRLLRYK